ncbi:MAG: response regulator [Magnetococcales bacterium]|nr:response regulator [Magnetococcales bacterium]
MHEDTMSGGGYRGGEGGQFRLTASARLEILACCDRLARTILSGEQKALVSRIRHLLVEEGEEWKREPPGHRERVGAAANGNALRQLSILVVEDNPLTQKLMDRLLGMQGHRVIVATDGQQALERMRSQTFDLVLMDLGMPVMDGFQATLAIRDLEAQKGLPHTPIIAVTARTDPTERDRVLQVGMDGFHDKPIRAERLFAEMDRVLDGRGETSPGSESAPASPRPGDSPELQGLEEGLEGPDFPFLMQTVSNDMELAREVIELYFTDANRHIERIRNGIGARDAEEVLDAAHSFKGASSALGRTRVYFLARGLETMGRSGDLSRAGPVLDRLEEALTVLNVKTRTWLAEQVR